MVLKFIVVLTMIGISGCSEQYPPPEVAIKACIDAGRIPIYLSDLNKTSFTCEEKIEKEY